MHLFVFISLILTVGTHEPTTEGAKNSVDITIAFTSTTTADYNNSDGSFDKSSRQFTTSFQTSTLSVIDSGSMTKQTYDNLKKSSVYIQFVLVVCAIFTNACNIIVFTRKRMRSTVSTIITFLSCSELAVAIVELIMVSCTAVLGTRTYRSYVFWALFQWCRGYLNVVFQRCSFCFNALVAVERFIAVCFPLKAKHILSQMRPFVVCVVTSLMISGIHIFNPLKMEVLPVNTQHGEIYLIQKSLLYTKNQDIFEILSFATKIIFSYFPLFGCFLVNILMVKALWNHKKQMKSVERNLNPQQQRQQQRQIQTTIVVLVSTFLFVLLSLPNTTTTIIQSTNAEYGELKREHYLFRFMVLFGGLLYLSSLSLDFVVYMILSLAFRQAVISWINSICRHRGGGNNEESTATTMFVSVFNGVGTSLTSTSEMVCAARDNITPVDGAVVVADGPADAAGASGQNVQIEKF